LPLSESAGLPNRRKSRQFAGIQTIARLQRTGASEIVSNVIHNVRIESNRSAMIEGWTRNENYRLACLAQRPPSIDREADAGDEVVFEQGGDGAGDVFRPARAFEQCAGDRAAAVGFGDAFRQ
jgi:hypothetical protein